MVLYTCAKLSSTHTQTPVLTNFGKTIKWNYAVLMRERERAIEEKRSCYLCNEVFVLLCGLKLFRYSLGCRDATVRRTRI